jgi:hypothetical protein
MKMQCYVVVLATVFMVAVLYVNTVGLPFALLASVRPPVSANLQSDQVRLILYMQGYHHICQELL